MAESQTFFGSVNSFIQQSADTFFKIRAADQASRGINPSSPLQSPPMITIQNTTASRTAFVVLAVSIVGIVLYLLLRKKSG